MTARGSKFRRVATGILRFGLRAAGTAAVLILLGLVLWCWMLPDYLENTLLPRLAGGFGFTDASCRVRRIGLGGADLDRVRLTGTDGRSVTVDSVRLNYSPNLNIFSSRPWLEVDEIVVSGLEVTVGVDDGGQWSIGGVDLTRLPNASGGSGGSGGGSAAVAVKRIELENIRLKAAWRNSQWLVPANFSVDLAASPIALAGQIELLAGEIDLSALYDPASRLLTASVAAEVRLEHLAGLLPFAAAGSLHVSGSTLLTLGAALPERAEVAIELTDAMPQLQQAVVQAVFSSDGAAAGAFTVEASARTPLGEHRFALRNGAVERAPAGWQAAGEVLLPELSIPGGPRIIPDASRFSISATQAGCAGVFAAGARAEYGDWQLKLGNLSAALTAGGLDVTAQAQVINPALKLVVAPIAIALDYPNRAVVVTVDSIAWRGMELAQLRAEAGLTDAGVALAGTVRTSVLGEESPEIEFEGRYDFTGDYAISGRLPLFRLPADTDLGAFYGGAPLFADGAIAAEAQLSSRGGQTASNGRISLVRCNLQLPESDIEVNNLNLALSFDDLAALRTPAGQRITVAGINAGAIDISKGEVKFQIASPSLFHLEESNFDWCSGSIATRYLRVIPGRTDYQTSIYCDGVNLAELLQQLGLANAEGDGKLWGKFPVSLTEDGVIFDDGYLYSIPGEESTIQLLDAEALVAAMTPELARSTQVDLALEALRDFRYQWARMHFVTEGDELAVRLQFNGRPLRPLPFNYNAETGAFFRVGVEAQAIFQGIDLTLDVRVPLNRLLKLNRRLNVFQQERTAP